MAWSTRFSSDLGIIVDKRKGRLTGCYFPVSSETNLILFSVEWPYGEILKKNTNNVISSWYPDEDPSPSRIASHLFF